MNKLPLVPCALVWAALAAPAAAQQPIVYPAKGQSAQQQQTDEGECHVWAKNQTGRAWRPLEDTTAAAPHLYTSRGQWGSRRRGALSEPPRLPPGPRPAAARTGPRRPRKRPAAGAA